MGSRKHEPLNAASHERENGEQTDLNDVTLHYLDVIYRLSQHGGAANTTDIAERLDVTPSGASVMLKRLAERKLIQLTPYKGATLTPLGRKIALRTIRRHRLLEMFMAQVMNFEWHQVDRHAHALETAIDEEFEDRMDEMLGHPTRCPHGHLIPSKDGIMPQVPDVALIKQAPGTSGVVRCIDTENNEWLEYFGKLGLVPGVPVTLRDIAPYSGPVTIQTYDDVVRLGRNLAELIYIEVSQK
jgi:DtxR family Mn-dependent transcriptional regulator